ncbi:MAG TPA: signal peptide peptidase SppA [Vicinamibacterales bacterium]|nr:signal peptide peptidase SppA [Vicinamibacterales bacterium]
MAVRRGIWVVIVLIVLAVSVSAIGMLLLISAVGREPQVSSNSTLVLRIGGDLNEMEPGGVLGPFMEGAPTVRGVVEMLRKAKTDKRITSVILKPSGAGALWGKVQEVRDAVADFRRSGKPIVAYLEYGGEQEFYLATACDKVFLMPTATLDLTGMASYELFLRGTLDKIGAYPDALHIGDYKTASNTLTEHTYTPAHKEMAESLNTDLYEQLVRGIADGRKKSEADVKTLIDHGPFLPEDALRAGLIDDLAYEDELDDKVKFASGKIRYLDMNEYRQVSSSSLGLNRGPKIAVIYATGIIASGKSTYDTTGGQVVGSETLVEYLRKARGDSSIKAIVLRVDSPGGSALASDVIWREVLLTKNQKPLIASMSDVAASGGYYISMPAHAIVAEPSTLTGSIGVVLTKFVIDGTLKKLGMNMEGVSQGKYANMYSPIRPFSPEERVRMVENMQATYDTFVEKAAQGRNTTPERIDAIAQGRVWTGRQAKEIGLVDELGGLDRAVALAKQRAKIAQDAEVELVIYPPKKSFYDLLRDPLGNSDSRASTLASLLGFGNPKIVQALAAPLQVFRRGEPLALMPNVFVR